ncbi:hypothetical protein QTG56_01555 [Rossellomorea sp. AcN35-11]|nr:hypothetical protein [Rossellomorea aquimaris]WJV29881.1 hypothetical protein QTG56_01555 [Rossellomorea sp. AcN35-11]
MIKEYTKVFMKISFSNKIGLIMIMVIPTIFMLWNNRHWFESSPSQSELLNSILIWWAYMIALSVINGVGVNMLILREQGFLKLFSFISGSTFPIYMGNVIAQLIFSFVSLTIFSTVVSIAFKGPWLTLFSTSLLLLAITVIPISLFVSWIPSLPMNQETITSLSTLIIFPLLFLTSNTLSTDSVLAYALLVNPVEIILQLSKTILNLVFDYELKAQFSLYSVLSVTLLYVFIGMYFVPRIKIMTLKTRS